MNNIILQKIELVISQTKHPTLFILSIFIKKKLFNDFNLSLILRLFLKYHFKFCLEINLLTLFGHTLKKRPKSFNVLNSFYKLFGKNIKLLLAIKLWKSKYNNPHFWKISLEEKINYLENIKHKFLAIYDNSKGGTPYYNKINHFYQNNKIDTINDIWQRLKLITKLINKKILLLLEIPLVSFENILNIDIKNLVTYMLLIYYRINDFLNTSIYLFQSYHINYLKIQALLNPLIIDIVDKDFNTNIIPY